jgi:hypothetical protein
MLIKKYNKKLLLYCTILCIITILLNGCARWSDDPNGGGGTGEKQLTVKVEINSNGQINTDDGIYYIVFNTNEDSSFPPDEDIDNWEDDYYFIKLDDFGFSFGVVGGTDSSFSGSAEEGDDFFQVSISLTSMDNPDKISMNVVTADTDNEVYDYLDFGLASNLTINDTSTIPSSNSIEDDTGDSTIDPDYDIYKVTTILSTP